MTPELLDCLTLSVPAEALEPFEAALNVVCRAVSFFEAEDGSWNLSGVKERGEREDELASALTLAEMLTGHSPPLARSLVPAGGWLARNQSDFPEQFIGERFAVRGTHVLTPPAATRITLTLDAGLAFGTGEHQSTRGCLLALERVARRRPRRLLDLGTGSGVLAIAAAKLLRRPVLATDIDPRAVRVAAANARLNQMRRVRILRSDGWANPALRRARYDLVFANILARPLCAMAAPLATALAPGGVAILAGLLASQAPMVLAAHRRAGLVLQRRSLEGGWCTLILVKPAR